MAASPPHKFGQIIGEILETAIEVLLQRFSKKHRLFLDKKGVRPARKGKKVSWVDEYGNEHDLDFVLERGGTAKRIGTPVAFIESAWRRYTKHSRNKAQEIQGAILPLASTHRVSSPFLGVILAGDYTEGALVQLHSLGFKVLHFSYDLVVAAFRIVGIDAYFDERTPDAEFSRKVSAWERLSETERKKIVRCLLASNKTGIQTFLDALESSVTRRVSGVMILPLHGSPTELGTVSAALEFLDSYRQAKSPSPVLRYEVIVRYTNGDQVQGTFGQKSEAVDFLKQFQNSEFRLACREKESR